jgi:hypothetical protein
MKISYRWIDFTLVTLSLSEAGTIEINFYRRILSLQQVYINLKITCVSWGILVENATK